MRKTICVLSALWVLLPDPGSAVSIEDVVKGLSLPAPAWRDSATTVSGLKEALTVGTDRAVAAVSKLNGYYGDEAIRILMPGQVQRVADGLRMAGYRKEVDDFVLSMNRAAAKAAPKAKAIFVDAVRQMSFDDANRILRGGNTAATDYFREKTSPGLFDAFKPVISDSMNDAAVTRSYKAMMSRYTSAIPFAKADSLDLDRYVTDKALEGLFYKLGQEEQAIRTNPAARTTELLRRVFGK